jgi:Skp family chaperone for outer membrane proteins
MKKLFALTLLSLFASGAAFAAANDPVNPQQDKMKACNTKAGDMKGDDRKAFMKTCLSAKPEKKESKMAMCNKKTAGMNKDDRAKAQSDCMKAS